MIHIRAPQNSSKISTFGPVFKKLQSKIHISHLELLATVDQAVSVDPGEPGRGIAQLNLFVFLIFICQIQIQIQKT